jgi:hypothetical protein
VIPAVICVSKLVFATWASQGGSGFPAWSFAV